MRLKRHARLGVIVAASFVLLVTVLPQLASGFGLGSLTNRLENSVISCSGSSGSSGSSSGSSGSVFNAGSASSGSSGSSASSGSSGSSSQCAPPSPGTLTGTVSVTGAPNGFTPGYEGAGACPSAESTTTGCTDPSPVYSLASNGTYSLSLAPGSWRVSGFYEINAFGGAFIGTGQTVTITSGATTKLDFTVPYAAPATLKGTVAVTGLPAGDTVQGLSVLLCPSFDPFSGTGPSVACVDGYSQLPTSGATSASYQVTGLPPGSWTVYPSYCTAYGCETNTKAGKSVTLVAGGTSTVNVTTPFVVPNQGLLTPSVTVTGAPKGFSDTLAVKACPQGGTNCQTIYETPGFAPNLLLATGAWTLTGYYLASPFDNAVPGPGKTVTIAGGRNTNVTLSVPYRVPGTAAGSIAVIGIPKTVSILDYTLVACPASSPLTASGPSLECASEYSGASGYGYGAADRNEIAAAAGTNAANAAMRPPAGVVRAATPPYNVYKVTSLTPGQWLLYPGYQTVFGPFSVRTGIPITVAAGKTVTRTLLVPYQKPAEGALAGSVSVIAAPANGFQSGVQACSAAPTTAAPCPGEEQAYSQTGGTYQLVLPAGTWWVSGFLYENGIESQTEKTSAPRQVAVVAGSTVTENFTVVGS